MADIRVVSAAGHLDKRWINSPTYHFARHDDKILIGIHEIPKVMMQLPLAFTRLDDGLALVALMGFAPGRNLVVTNEGRWLAEYIPVLYRCYPFRIARNGDGNLVLCVDHASGLVQEGITGYRFLDDDKKPAAETKAAMTALVQLENERPVMKRACSVLEQYGVVEPWPLKIQMDESQVHSVENIFRIDEVRLNQLPGEALNELLQCGGLTMSYGQLFSMQHIRQLATLTQRQHWAEQAHGNQQPALNIVDEEGILSFSRL